MLALAPAAPSNPGDPAHKKAGVPRSNGTLAAIASALACDTAGVIISRRKSGYYWIDAESAAAGDASMMRIGFLTAADAAHDACAVLGLDRRSVLLH